MYQSILHIFRNTPFGKEAFLQSLYFSSKAGNNLSVYIPKHDQFLMYFPNKIVTVDLDRSFLHDKKTAVQHVKKLVGDMGVDWEFVNPTDFTAFTLPNIPIEFKYMCCPRSISDLSSKISLGYIGPKVREIIQNAPFSILVPTPVYKEWNQIVVFFGGSQNAIRALRKAMELQRHCGFPIRLFSKSEGKSKDDYRKILADNDMLTEVEESISEWMFYETGTMKEILYDVPSDALAVMGAYGHGLVKELLMGSKMEKIQSILPANMLIVGPNSG